MALTATASRPAPLLLPRRASPDAALALSAFFGSGGLLCLLSLMLPAWGGRDEDVILAVGFLASGVALALAATRNLVSRRTCYGLVLLGSGMIAALVHAGAGGAASATYAGFYVWVAVYSFLYFPPRGAAVQVLVGLLLQAAALWEVGEGSVAPAQLALSAGTMLSTGAVVGLLSARLRTLTLTDELTGLPNRRALDATLRDRLGQDRRGRPVAVLGIDLDGFKRLNDTAGHAAGDALLREVAGRWSAELRHGDVLARAGGDEFIAVLTDCTQERARVVAERIVAAVPPPVSACVGVVVVRADDARVQVDAVLADVDAALYEGKAQGTGSVVVLPAPGVPDLPVARPASG